ncbi:MAG: hypothetical protein HY593_00660, partial [Candidatus Omnitrophica bacterium]|nr:hypothetical protein [Candidatus Omnitrophota bacterium]
YDEKGEEFRRIKEEDYKKIILENQKEAYQITLPLSDFKLLWDRANRAVEELPFSKVLDEKEAVEVMDLKALNPQGNLPGFEEAVLPLMLEEWRASHGRPWAKKGVVLLEGEEYKKTIEAYISKKKETNPKEDWDFIYTNEKDLPENYKTAPRILVTTPEGAEARPILRPNTRLFVLQVLKPGDILNTRLVARISLTLARLEKVAAQDPRYLKVKQVLEKILGFSFNDKDFIDVTTFQTKDFSLLQRYALPPLTTLPIHQLLQGARLALRMIQQAA